MFEKYSYKVKFKALLVIFCLLLITAYKRSFSSLIGLVKENRELTEKAHNLKDKSGNVNVLTSEVAALNRVIGKEGIDKEKVQQDIVRFVLKHNPGLSIHNIKSIHEFSDESYRVYTNEIDVTGNIDQLLALSYDFEKRFDSRLVSMNFYTTKKNNETNALHLKLIFQNYENK